MKLPVLSPHPTVFLSSIEELKSYLRTRQIEHFVQPFGVSLSFDMGDIVYYDVDVHWGLDQVRFFATSGLSVAPTQLAATALLIEQLNAEIGFPVWRVLPVLTATYTVTLDHTGAMSSRVFEYAFALLKDAIARDRPRLQAHLQASAP